MRTLKHIVKPSPAALAVGVVAFVGVLLPGDLAYAEDHRTQRVRPTDKKVESVEVTQPDVTKSLVVRSQVSVPDYVLSPRTIADVIDRFRALQPLDTPPTNTVAY